VLQSPTVACLKRAYTKSFSSSLTSSLFGFHTFIFSTAFGTEEEHATCDEDFLQYRSTTQLDYLRSHFEDTHLLEVFFKEHYVLTQGAETGCVSLGSLVGFAQSMELAIKGGNWGGGYCQPHTTIASSYNLIARAQSQHMDRSVVAQRT